MGAPTGQRVADCNDSQPKNEDLARCEMVPEPASDIGKGEHRQREGQHGEAGLQRGSTRPILQEQRQQRRHHLRTGGIGEHRQHRADEPWNAITPPIMGANTMVSPIMLPQIAQARLRSLSS